MAHGPSTGISRSVRSRRLPAATSPPACQAPPPHPSIPLERLHQRVLDEVATTPLARPAKQYHGRRGRHHLTSSFSRPTSPSHLTQQRRADVLLYRTASTQPAIPQRPRPVPTVYPTPRELTEVSSVTHGRYQRGSETQGGARAVPRRPGQGWVGAAGNSQATRERGRVARGLGWGVTSLPPPPSSHNARYQRPLVCFSSRRGLPLVGVGWDLGPPVRQADLAPPRCPRL
jgi:hypothetical protein